MERRIFLRTAGGALLGALAGAASAQQREYKVAWLSGSQREQVVPLRNILLDTLARNGFVEGKNLRLAERYGQGRLERLATLAREISEEKPDVIISSGTQATLALRDATRDVPIVFAFLSDPVESGLVADLSHPGGRITGFTNMNFDLIGKRLEMLRLAFPEAQRVTVLHNPRNSPEAHMLSALRKAASALGIQLGVAEIGNADDLAKAFAAMERRAPDALFVLENPTNVTHRARIIEFAERHRIRAIYGFESFVEAGGLMAYCAPQTDQFAGASEYVARLLRGAKVADLPVQLPGRFILVVNLQAAKRSGISFPAPFLARADRVIE